MYTKPINEILEDAGWFCIRIGLLLPFAGALGDVNLHLSRRARKIFYRRSLDRIIARMQTPADTLVPDLPNCRTRHWNRSARNYRNLAAAFVILQIVGG